MKVVFIIYGISWLVLLLILVIVGFRQGFRFVFNAIKDAEWWMPWLLLLVAPLLPIILLFVLFDKKEPWKSKANEEQQKQMEHEKQLRIKEFNNSIACTDMQIIADCVELWKQIVAFRDAKQYDNMTKCLSEINVANGYTLNMSLCKTPQDDEYFIGDDSYLYVASKDGKQERDIFKFITVTNSEKSAWQAFVLHELWRILPHFWHGGYNYRTFIFDKQDLQKVVDSVNKNPHTYDVSIDVAKFDVRPQITKNGHNYFVSYCYWNDWEGLVHEVVGIRIIDGKVVEINALSKTVGYKYDCGIRY